MFLFINQKKLDTVKKFFWTPQMLEMMIIILNFTLFMCVQAGCSAFPFYSPTKPLIRLYIKYKTVLIPY